LRLLFSSTRSGSKGRTGSGGLTSRRSFTATWTVATCTMPTAEGRKAPNTDQDRADLKSMVAYTGMYRIEGDKWITKVDVSGNPAWVGLNRHAFSDSMATSSKRARRLCNGRPDPKRGWCGSFLRGNGLNREPSVFSMFAPLPRHQGTATLLTSNEGNQKHRANAREAWKRFLWLLGGHEKRRLRYMKAREFDKKFDEGGDISKYLDISKARRPKQEQKRVNVDFPIWMIQLLDKEAKRLGVPRQSIIKVWVAERLEKAS